DQASPAPTTTTPHPLSQGADARIDIVLLRQFNGCRCGKSGASVHPGLPHGIASKRSICTTRITWKPCSGPIKMRSHTRLRYGTCIYWNLQMGLVVQTDVE